MSAPRPGDRVRVTTTVEGRYSRRGSEVVVTEDAGSEHVYNYELDADRYTTVEVLASPVYVNSDTTEYREGDVARIGEQGETVVRRRGQFWYYSPHSAAWQTVDPKVPLTLLVRDGEVVR